MFKCVLSVIYGFIICLGYHQDELLLSVSNVVVIHSLGSLITWSAHNVA